MRGGGGIEFRNKVEHLEKGRVEVRGFFKVWVYFSLSYSNLIGDKFN